TTRALTPPGTRLGPRAVRGGGHDRQHHDPAARRRRGRAFAEAWIVQASEIRRHSPAGRPPRRRPDVRVAAHRVGGPADAEDAGARPREADRVRPRRRHAWPGASRIRARRRACAMDRTVTRLRAWLDSTPLAAL